MFNKHTHTNTWKQGKKDRENCWMCKKSPRFHFLLCILSSIPAKQNSRNIRNWMNLYHIIGTQSIFIHILNNVERRNQHNLLGCGGGLSLSHSVCLCIMYLYIFFFFWVSMAVEKKRAVNMCGGGSGFYRIIHVLNIWSDVVISVARWIRYIYFIFFCVLISLRHTHSQWFSYQ